MSFAVPRNVPSFQDPQRADEDRLWQAAGMTSRGSSRGHQQGGLLGGVHSRVDGFLGTKSQLPMYKDKPYTYAASRRLQPFWRRKRSALGLVVLVLTGLYFFGAFADHSSHLDPAQWTWLRTPEPPGNKADWDKRRERVKEAFELSWDAYARYGWGELDMFQSWRDFF
jgi:endoplasmic reticulum Man9GlcNAc2 1,2-alpha-mannosidase